MDIGVVVGRFQVDELHDGHRALLNLVAKASDLVCVVLGVTENLGSRRNPLDFQTRKMLVEDWGRVAGISDRLVVLPHADDSSDLIWSQNLDRMISRAFPGHSVKLYGGRDSFLKAYQGKYKSEDLSGVTDTAPGLAATGIRQTVSKKPLSSADFRRGVIYGAYNQWPRLFMCVDIAVLRGDELILGQRDNEAQPRFFGGFVDQRDESLESAALRELREEAGIPAEQVHLEFVTSRIIRDHRYRGSDDGLLMTSLFVAHWKDSWVPILPLAGDDMDGIVRLKVSQPDLISSVMPCHRELMASVVSALSKESK